MYLYVLYNMSISDLKNNKKATSYFVKITASIIGGFLFYYLIKFSLTWVPNLAEVLDQIKQPLKDSKIFKTIALILFIIIAILLTQLKKKIIILYGLIEFSGGIWTILATLNQSFENNILYALAISGGVFLLINGIENIYLFKKKMTNHK